MINAKEAAEKLRSMTPEDRFEVLKNKVSEKTRNALDTKIKEVIAACESNVDITLSASICRYPDADIRWLLMALGYAHIDISSDFPSYTDSYEGTTHIRFSIPA